MSIEWNISFQKTDLEVPEHFRKEKQFNRCFYLPTTRQESSGSMKNQFQNILRQTELLRVYWKNNYTLKTTLFFFTFQEIEISRKQTMLKDH